MTEPQVPQSPKDAGEPAQPDATMQLAASARTDPGRTVRLEPPPAPPTSVKPPAGGSRAGWILGGVLVAAALGIGAYVLLGSRPGASTAFRPQAAPGKVPPGVQVYLDQAQAGDPHAMRMLGVMYYYGLNVPQDREKGLVWYRKAAEKGSEAAREELAKLDQARSEK